MRLVYKAKGLKLVEVEREVYKAPTLADTRAFIEILITTKCCDELLVAKHTFNKITQVGRYDFLENKLIMFPKLPASLDSEVGFEVQWNVAVDHAINPILKED